METCPLETRFDPAWAQAPDQGIKCHACGKFIPLIWYETKHGRVGISEPHGGWRYWCGTYAARDTIWARERWGMLSWDGFSVAPPIPPM